MLKKRKKVIKIITKIIAIIMILGFFIKFNKVTKETYAPTLKYTKAGEIKISATTGLEHGTIKPIYKPKWEKVSSSFDKEKGTLTVTVKGIANETKNINENTNVNYASDVTSSLKADDITVFINGKEVTNKTNPKITVSEGILSTNASTGKQEVTHTIVLSDFEETARQPEKDYKEWSGNVTLKISGRGKEESTYMTNILTDENGNQNMMETDEDGSWIDVTINDEDTDRNTANKMFADFIKPEFTYIYSNGNIDHTNKTLTIEFSVTDKYFNTSTVLNSADKIIVKLLDTDTEIPNANITKNITKIEDITEERDGEETPVKIGEKYKLVIGGLEQVDEKGIGNGETYSGPMSITFPSGLATDTSSNSNITKTITIGVNEPDNTGNQEIVDVVDPVWTVASSDPNTGIIKIRVKDKYLIKDSSKFELAKEDIKIIVNDVESTAIVKTLDGPTEITADQEYEYTLTISNIVPVEGGYTEFTPINPIVGGTAKYKNENGGNIKLKMEAGTITDKYGNSTKEQILAIGNVDYTGPELFYIQKTRDVENNKETIVFNVTDKNYKSTKLITPDEISVWIDGTQVDNQITKKIAKAVEIKTTIDGIERIVGHQYTLEIGSIAETDEEFLNSNRAYRELSGALKIEIDENAVTDVRGNTLNPDTATITDRTDVVKPEIIYKHSTSDINKTDKTYTMVFDMIDKYYDAKNSTELKKEDLTIKVDGKVPDWNEVTRSLQKADITETVNGTNKVIGKRYTLQLSNLEQLQVKEKENYLNYSGVITVVIPANKMADETGNKNISKTITSGINIPGGTGTGEIVDVVDPLIEKESTSANAIDKTATLKFKVTDKYFKASTIAKDNIKIYVNREESSTAQIETFESSELKEERTVDGSTTTVQYGVEYTLTVKGFDTTVNQVKIKIPAGLVTDNSGNGNKETDLVLYNTLKPTYTGTYDEETNSESKETSPFLGNTKIQRQNIDNITFMNNIPANVGYDETTQSYKDSTTWDVSAEQDKSILAWYTTNANGSLKVYIGSDSEIFANQDSTDLFAYIGKGDKCTSTETITNIDLLNVNSVTNMYRMFRYTGYKSMKKLELGSKFDTSNVTNMKEMFESTGYTAMTDINLGANFNTSKVTDMSNMFKNSGYTKLTGLNLGTKFDTTKVIYMNGMFNATGYTEMTTFELNDGFNTSNVTDMSQMFYQTGSKKLKTLNLKDGFNTAKVTNMSEMFKEMEALTKLDLKGKFDTSKVTNMSGMFWGTGSSSITEIKLGDKFNTSNVTNMNSMFYETGKTTLTNLDLGDKFYTTNVTDMTNMFYQCGQTAMTTIDLGPAFTKIAGTHDNMFYNTGKSGVIIKVAESIYLNKNNFKLNADTTDSAIEYTRGTINPKYRTEWVKQSSTINTTNKNITITLKGRTNAEVPANEYKSDVTSTLTTDDIHVYFDGEEADTITKSITEATTTSNGTTGANDVVHVLTLSNLEEELRQQGKSYKEWSGNISLKINKKTLSDKYGNQNLQAIDTTGEMVDIEIKETNKVEQNTNGTMFTDYIKPEITYVYSDKNINYTNKTLTVEFSVVDKYFSSTTLGTENIADELTVKLIDTDSTISNKKITKELTKVEDVNETRDGKSVKIGEKYRLVISGLEQQTVDGKYKDYSGPMSISIPAGVATDKSGNTNNATTITIGVNEPDNTGNQQIVDVVDPTWKTENINIDHTNKKVTVDLIGTDKYYASCSLTTANIKVYVDGEEVTTTANVKKSLVEDVENPLTEIRKVDGVDTQVQYGVRYTLTLTDWEEVSKQTGKNFFEWSGTTKIEIGAGTIKDQSNNTSKKQEFELGYVDFIKPKIEKVSSNKNDTDKTETITFNVIDKYLDISKQMTADEITVSVDGEEASTITKTLTRVTANDVSKTINGKSQVVSQQYQLVLSDFEQARTSINYDREYSDWSGNVSIKIAEGAVKDKNTPNPNVNEETTIAGDFVDFIKPNVTYRYTESDIDYDGKTFTMVFDITDKHFSASTLLINDLNIKIDNEEPNWDNTGVHGVAKELTSEDITNTVNGEDKVIGKRYTLKLSHLEQLEKLDGKETLDYSGVITVAIPENKVTDTTGNKNNAITITSGIEIKGEEVTGDGTIVDVVDPIWEKVNATVNVNEKTATITVKGTDKYFASSNLIADKIKVLINGNEVTSNINIRVGTATAVNSEIDKKQIGNQYVINISGDGLDLDKNQVKIRIEAGTITDKSGNKNKDTELTLVTTLAETNTETEPTSGLLGSKNSDNEKVNKIERQNIDNITFVDNIPASVYDRASKEIKDDTAWDVSVNQDKSILAWYTTNDNGTLKVYIGSDDEIFGNIDSSYLFANIGYSDKCTSTETISNIGLLNVESVTNMTAMFKNTGYNSMTEFILGDKFDTRKVTNMSHMFEGIGHNSMTSFELTGKFDTSKVTDMSDMFSGTGYTKMASFKLGSKFYTENVTEMSKMFYQTGKTKLTTLGLGDNFNTGKVTNMSEMFKEMEALTELDLKDKFDTSKVTNMSGMFWGTGSSSITEIKLGDKFDTSNVTNMNSMFYETGKNTLTALDLGDKFYTTNVTDMTSMFYQTGLTAMTTIDLGPAFTKIAGTNTDMFTNTGKDGEITIYTSEPIYLNKNNFKLNTDTTDSAIEYTRGTINPKYRTEWVKQSSTISTTNKNITITLKGRTNAEVPANEYTSDVTSSLTTDNIHVYFDGEEANTITKTLTEATTTSNSITGANDVVHVLTLSDLEEELRQQGKSYKEWSGNISLKIDKKTLSDKYGNQNLQAIDTTGEMVDIEFKDSTTDKNTNGTMFTDYINPELTYVYSNGNIDYDNKTLTVEFSVTDKYFDLTTLSDENAVNNLAIKLIDTDSTIPDEKITKELTKVEDINETRNGEQVKIGEKYRLVISGLEQQTADGKYKDYSGPMSISIPAGVATDKSGNTNIATTITIGVNEPDNTGNQQIVDVVDPMWKTDNINIDHINKKVTVDLMGTDKYYASDSLTTAKIKVYVDGEEVTTTENVKKELSEAVQLKETRKVDGVDTQVQYGVKYTLTLTDWEEVSKRTGKDFFEWSGTTKIEIEAGTITDESNNTSNKQEFELGHVDFIRPKIEKVSSNKDSELKTETIIFNVIDKYLDTSKELSTDEISVYVDGELVPTSQITRTLTRITANDVSKTINGKSQVVSQQYQLVLSDFEQARTSINYDREYSDWSGNVSIKIAEGAVKDKNTPNPNVNEETTIDGDFVDFIKPNTTYRYTESDIDYNGKTFTMVFDITDKYYKSGTLAIGDLNIKIDGETPNWDNTGVHGVTKELTSEDITNTVKGEDKVIGKRYTLKLTHLEQLEKLAGKETMDYSGVITVAVPAEKLVDTTDNKNNAITITSGIEIKGEEITGDGTIVDVVDPIWEKVSSTSSANGQTATIIVKGTDKYFASSNLTADKIEVYVNGEKVSTNVNVDVGTQATPVYASDGTTRIGDQYTVTVSGTGLAKSADQIKIRIKPNTIEDNSGNTNKETDLLLFNALRKTDTETEATNGLLGSASSTNENVKTIQRQNIDNITFVEKIPSTVYDKSAQAYVDNTAWDVSSMQDKSILAWYTTNANGTLKVYIGSDNEIFANYDSSNLFGFIGSSDNCTSIETITNINLLNVESVTSMKYMFRQTGTNAMTKLELGNKFNTSNVTNMAGMFEGTGYKNMTTINLGNNFITNSVTDMNNMFNSTGYTAMTNLDLGSKFNTSAVTDMNNMFNSTGYTAMTSLDLGSNFNTSAVTDMNNMFNSTGYTAMTNLNLRSQFNTSKVTKMNSMFEGTGYTAMTSLNLGTLFDTSLVIDMNKMFYQTGHEKMTTLTLGDKFNTSKVTNMSYMFSETGLKVMTALDLGDMFYTTVATDMSHMFENVGQTLMTSLDLGPAFTKIAETNTDMFTNTGKDTGITIYASEQIYLDKNNFKLNTNATDSAIEYTRGTINPKYRTEWIKESSTISTSNKNIAITLKGRTNAEAGIDFTSDVTSSLTADNIHVFYDGEEVTTITKTVGEATTTTNEITGANDVLQVITLSNLEEELRQQGKNYKEWSGNISLKIDKKTLTDKTYKNQNLQAIDTTGEMIDIVFEDEKTNKNTDGTMFTDYINPEFTYEYSKTTINYEQKNVTVVFDVTDKYFKQSTISLNNTTIKVDGVEPDWTKVTRTFTKKALGEDKTEGNIVYKANGDIYTTINGTEQKIGERYELILDGLETQNGEGYSGNVTLAFPDGVITDQSGNKNIAKTITIGVDEPKDDEHKDPVVVDVVNPLWSYGTSSINRVRDGAEADTVDVTIIGSDKYYDTNTLTTDKIKVYVDDVLESSITKNLTPITDTAILKQLATKQGLADTDNLKFVGYKLTLGNFGTINGVTKVVIDEGTILDKSGNKNLETTIPVGNPEWVENGDSSANPIYTAFRENIVDFIKPVIKYTYSAVEGATNPTIDYEAKTLTVKFTVTDKYIRQDSIINADGTLNANNIKIKVAGTDLTEQLHTTVTAKELDDRTGTEYTFVISNFELVYNESEKYQDYSGEVDFVFSANKVDDTSGNKNNATTITLDYDDGDDTDNPIIVDVIDPVIERTDNNLSKLNSSNGINRDLTNETGTVSVRIQATDKYLDKGMLQNAENVEKMKVKVVKPDGETVYPDTITKQVSQVSKQATSITYQVTLGNFGENEGVTSIIIPEGVIVDKYGNTNKETEVLVGNATWTETGDSKGEYTAFRNSIVDFTRPIWEYSTSSITRNRDEETGTVTIKILGRDKYYLKDTLTESNIFVYVDNTENPDSPVTSITKKLTKIKDTAELDGANTGYILTLGNFGTHDGAVKISIADNTIKDSSGNGNKITDIPVGNPDWVETDISDNADNPKYTAFRNNIVDFIKPKITYKYADGTNPVIDRENKQVSITFDVTDTNFLESDILSVDDIQQILVDDYDVTDTITKQLIKSDITDGSGNGIRYTLTLSNFEVDSNLENEIFRRHSGKIEFVIGEGKVRDTSGNMNIETKIIVDNDNGDNENNYIRVDFIKPKLFYKEKFISYAQRYATVTISGTDRFYDFDTKLTADDISIYELNRDGQYIQRTDLPIKVTPVKTQYGYDFVVRLDDFEEEFRQLKISIPAGKISDLDENTNDATDILVDLDNRKPVWKYTSTDTSQFESDGKISFNVKGQDTFLDIEKSGLEASNIKIQKDGTDVTEIDNITVNYLGADATEISKSYKIDVSGLTEVGSYSLIIEKETLVDQFNNKSATTTITFSKSAISSNTDNYTMVTYHATPDFEQMHQAYVHELMNVNESGTNAESTTYRASSIGEIYDNGNNTLFAEPFKYENGTQSAYSFKGWAVANEKGFSADNAKIYGLYEDIPNTVTNLNATWQNATVIFVSKNGNNSNDGKSPTTPVKDLKTAYSKLNADGTDTTNIIVVMDKIEWNSGDTLTGNATITSLYAGVDYRKDGAELQISSNMNISGDIVFDNIKLYSSSTTVSDGSDYLATGEYSNVLVTNYGDVILGRGISTPDDKYTFGAVVGGNYKEETTKDTIGIHTVIVEAGKYNNIIVGSSLNTPSTTRKYVSHQVMIGTIKESAISRNDKVTITGYLSMGELEDRCYPYNRDGSQDTALGYTRYYAISKIYSATFTGENKFNKAEENASIYLRSINGFNDGKVQFDMYGGNVTGNIYGGARMATSKDSNETEQPDVNIMNFYGGQITGNVFGHGGNDTSTGNSIITLSGCIGITGNVFGGSNATTEADGKITGNTNIIVNSSIIVNGNIYGGSNGVINGTTINRNTGLITGNTNVTLNVGTVRGEIYGGGYNCGVTGTANINMNNGQVTGSIYGGAYQNQVQTETNVNIFGGTVEDVYGGNALTSVAQLNSDNSSQNANIIIGNKDLDTTPRVNGTVYGSGKYDRLGTVEIQLIKCNTTPAVFGGSDTNGITSEANIYLNDMTASTVYGGSRNDGTVTKANIYLNSGTVTDIYGGGYGGSTTTANVNLDGTATVTSIYGGPNTSGKVETSNVDLKSGNITNVYGGGNSADVVTANVTLNGITIDSIHGGSKKSGVTTNTNVILNSGTVINVYGAGLDAGAVNANVTQIGATVTNIYGGSEGDSNDTTETINTKINVNSAVAKNIYGGSLNKGSVRNATINITGTSTITGKLYGGGYQSNVGKSGNTGSTTINVTGGTINNDIVGGSERGVVYGNTNINIGKDSVADTTLTAGNISIHGNIYGAGNSTNTNYSDTSVYGDTHVTLDNGTDSPITFTKSIFGAGNGANYSSTGSSDGSTVKIKDFGSTTNAYNMISIQRTGKVSIQNSYLELTGAQDKYNYYQGTSYTLNKITNGLVLLDNSTLYTRRGFNMVGGFESLVTTDGSSTTKATVAIENNQVTKNVDNRLYTYEGVNLIFAKQEGDLSNMSNQDIWGDVNGMAFFGMYRTNRTTGAKEYDIYAPDYSGTATTNMFANGTYIEGRHKANHDTTVDGFYTNIVGEDSNIAVPQVIDVTDNGTYYDWIIGANIVNYNASLIASTYSTYSIADLNLNFKQFVDNANYNGTIFTIDRVSTNAFDEESNLINKLSIPTYSENANNTFGLTMQTSNSGWLQGGTTNLYTDSDGSFDGTTVYKTDNSTEPGNIIFKLFNSVNVSETKDLGYVNITLTGKARQGEDASIGKVFKVVIAINVQSLYEDMNANDSASYITRFTDSTKTELNYTTDSAIDMSYVLYKSGIESQSNIYATGDYRVLSTSTPLPKDTKITLRDYGQGDDVNKVYYYQVASDTDYDATDNSSGSTRYLYKLSKFVDMGGTSDKYSDNNNKYYHTSADTKGYALEKYDISIDFMNSNLDTNKLAQETYLELRTSSGAVKYDNGDKEIKYNLYNQKAVMSENVTTGDGKTSYTVFENLAIPFTFDSSLLEQKTDDGLTIKDTKYYEKRTGIAIEIVDEHGERIHAPEVQNLQLTDVTESTVYKPGADGVIRIPLSDGLAKIENSYVLSLSQNSVPAGQYIAKIYFFSSDDGKYYIDSTTEVQDIYITFINKLLGLAGLESADGSRIINKNTRLNLDGGNGLDLTVKVGSPTNDTNIRVELYKRNSTYTTDEEDGTNTYNEISYTKVDLKDYLQSLDGSELKTPEDYSGQGLVTADGCKEYMVMEKKSHPESTGNENIETVKFEKAIKDGISTGEYKLVFKAYYNNTLIQTIRKSFIVTQ